MIKLALIFLIWVTAWTGTSAQRLGERELLPLPPSGISDESGVLGRNSSAHRRIVELLHQLERDHGYRLMLVLHNSLIDTTATELAAQLQQQWLPEGRGLVIVYESDTRDLGLGRGLEAGEGMSPDDGGIASFALVGILSSALDEEAGDESSGVYIERVVTRIAEEIDGHFQRKMAPVSGGRSLRLALVTIGALSLLALCGMGLGWLMGKSESKQSEVRIFPQQDIPERLGAPYGGGCGGSNSFGSREN